MKSIFYTILPLICISYIYASPKNQKNYFIFPNIGTQKIYYDDLVGMPKDQLSLIRNEIYARHGYQFKSDTLRKYFYSQIWYNEKIASESDINLNPVEKWNVDIIQRFEENCKLASPKEILFQEPYTDRFLMVYALCEVETRQLPFLYVIPRPEEYENENLLTTLEKSAVYKAEIEDASSQLRASQISIQDIDPSLPHNQGEEIIIGLHGPSDDHSDLVLGFDKAGNVIRYFHAIGGFLRDIYVNEKHMIFRTQDWGGSFNYYRKYLFDSESKNTIRINPEISEVKTFTTITKDSVKIFTNVQDALNYNLSADYSILPPQTDITITSVYISNNPEYGWDKHEAFFICSAVCSGWLNMPKDERKLNLHYAD